MQRVRKIIESGDLIVMQIDQQGLGRSNALYLLEFSEFADAEYDAAIGRAIRERAQIILDGEPNPEQSESGGG